MPPETLPNRPPPTTVPVVPLSGVTVSAVVRRADGSIKQDLGVIATPVPQRAAWLTRGRKALAALYVGLTRGRT